MDKSIYLQTAELTAKVRYRQNSFCDKLKLKPRDFYDTYRLTYFRNKNHVLN